MVRFAPAGGIISGMSEGNDEGHFQRVLWHSRRGMLELDLLLVEFARRRYPLLSKADRSAYRGLLELEDPVLHEWLQGRRAPVPAFARIVELVRAFHSPGEDGAGTTDGRASARHRR